jgi:phage gp29-like protein
LTNQALTAIEKPATRKGLTKEIASREYTIDFMSVILGGLPNPDPILRKLGRAIDVYEDLAFDSRVSACVTSRKSAVKAMEWDLVGEDVNEADIDFHKEYINNYKLEDIFSEVLDAWMYGYKPMEIIWETDGGKIIPSKFVGKPPRWFKYDEDNELRFLSMEDMISGEELPENKFIIARNEATYDNPYGRAVLSACYWPVTFRRNGMKFWTIFVEKYGMPFLHAKAEAGAKEERITEIADMLENMVQDAIAVTPEEFEVELLETSKGKGGEQSAHKTYIDTMNVEIAMAILGTNLTTEVSGGSFAATKSHMEVRDDIVEGDAKIIEGAFSELIRITHNLNIGSSRPAPTFKLFAEEKVEETRAKRDKDIQDADKRVKLTADYYKRAYNFTDDDFELIEVPEAVPEAVPVGTGDGGKND